MALLRKNIWTIFYIFLIGNFIFLSFASYLKWNNLHKEYAKDQINLVKIVSNSMHSLLLSQESTLDILGHQLSTEQHSKLLDDLLVLNPLVIAYGFTDVNGTYLHVNSKFDKTKLPNLKQNPLTQDSFDYTLSQKKMVLGRTYFISGGGRWGIPIRKTIFDSSAKVQGVMTAGLNIEGAFKLFSENLSLGNQNKVVFIRDRDKFIQYQSSEKEIPKEIYATALSEHFFQTMLQKVIQQEHVSLEEIKSNRKIHLTQAQNQEGILEQIALKYDPRYELWTLSHIEHQEIIDDFMENFYIYVVVFLLINSTTFLLFRIIAHAEKQRRNDLLYQATHDDLTKLPNRSYLKKEIQRWIYEGAPPFSLYYLDMDHFKDINDSFGHQYGDLLLIEFTKRLSRMVRKDSVIVRQGGDEFIILTYRTDAQEILTHAQTILNENAMPYQVQQLSFIVGASIGIAKYPEHGTTLDMLLRAADIAMYKAKKNKNSVCLFEQTMEKSYLNRVSLEQALRKGLENDEFFMVYQPQLDTNANVYGVEALIRWNHPDLGLIPPDAFIPIAETAGIMPRLGDFVLMRTLDEMKQLQAELGICFQVSINISVKQFMDTNFFKKLSYEIENKRLKNIALCLEITENLFIEDVDYIVPLLQKIRQMGLSISMDDFGTGYSSLSMLKQLPIDELKIDKSFIQTILSDITTQKMVQNIITIGKNFELHVLAEGVEEQAQEALLKTFGCDRFQGYLYAKPLAYNDLKAFFLSQRKEHACHLLSPE